MRDQSPSAAYWINAAGRICNTNRVQGYGRAAMKSGMGLRIMAYRAALLGGKLHIESKGRRGVVLILRIDRMLRDGKTCKCQ